ncbi:MAG TPA: phosphate ABC transporter substrate-binding protein PstS [Solirubrobacteraceae bacterium]|nr:phosphate ABC transporter substrate-binding protein PstS [Solirubrobacteraceae bacterium]
MKKKLIRTSTVLFAVAASLGLAACGSSSNNSGSGGSSNSSSSSNLTGAGSTLVAPLLSQWQPKYDEEHGVAVTYGAIGSGGGIEQITARTVDFGASDAPLTSSQASACKGCVQIPWALSATAIAYHVQGVPTGLKLTGPILSDIWLGKIKAWNDPAIKKLNPGVNLPSTKITPVYRTDGSGDTYAFTNYLSHVSSEWKSKVGTSTQVHFPVGLGGKGNSGVGGVLTSTNGSIAYVALAYVVSNKFTDAAVQNAAGKFETPGISSISAAAATVKSVPSDNAISIVDPPASASGAYPISTFTYVIVPKKSPKASGLKKFITWALGSEAQALGPKLDFAPLPAKVVTAGKNTLNTLG